MIFLLQVEFLVWAWKNPLAELPAGWCNSFLISLAV